MLRNRKVNEVSGQSGNTLARVLWFVATGLALIAFGLGYLRKGEFKWSLLAAAAFLLAMGLGAWSKRGKRDAST